MASVMMFALVGCGNTASEDTSETTEVTEATVEENGEDSGEEVANGDTNLAPADGNFEYNGKSISFTDDAKTVMETIDSVAKKSDEGDIDGVAGKWYNYDKTGSNPNLEVVVMDVNGKDTVGLIKVNNEGITTSNGISIGSKMEDVETAYGRPSEEMQSSKKDKSVAYRYNDFNIMFEIKDGQVSSITYTHPEYNG